MYLKKVNFSHTRYRALGPELITVYRQSVRRWLLSHPPGGRLPLLSARPAVTFPVEQHHRQSASTKLYCLVTEAHGCEQLAQGCYSTAWRPGLELVTTDYQPHTIYPITNPNPEPSFITLLPRNRSIIIIIIMNIFNVAYINNRVITIGPQEYRRRVHTANDVKL